MPPHPGEERLLTVFADIHYYFTAPTARPSDHRFEKGSYLYIYYDPSTRKARIEVANNPGTPEQDAFHGSLDSVHIQHASHFPTRCSLTVEGVSGSVQQQTSHYDWRLPGIEPCNAPSDLPRIHTVDIYFWTLADANEFLDVVERILLPSQLMTDRPNAQMDQPISPVVQQLENIAVSDPAYQNGQTPNSRSDHTVGASQVTQPLSMTPSFPPPPPGEPSNGQANPGTTQPLHGEQRNSANFAPLPYNPAAPAAPEPIQHREKTPPPEDGSNGTGLAAAMAADHGVSYAPSHQSVISQGNNSFAPPPISASAMQYPGISATGPTGYVSPPPSVGLTHSNSFSSQPSMHKADPSSGFTQHSQGQGWQNSAVQGTTSFAPPPQEPNAHLYSQGIHGGPQSPHQHPGQATPLPGYLEYSYGQSSVSRPVSSEYDIHNQLYRPTEAEASGHGQKYAKKAMKSPERPRKLEDKAFKAESGVNRFLKKLERKL
ncbi:Uncharacterized protein PECH_006966 [Penicillium ucsense]|uniref:RNA recognition motif-containing protein n=1 Tax=Penicillium ucsense TaxID=2839758 RepID=A0A8J8W5L2_9EURO|nr:Uncharacterized protein PECM_005062 [Penicillium ucsense]KAF7739004.1 Uncharacterized protein PECH_006966 [Penicillium ucsense]